MIKRIIAITLAVFIILGTAPFSFKAANPGWTTLNPYTIAGGSDCVYSYQGYTQVVTGEGELYPGGPYIIATAGTVTLYNYTTGKNEILEYQNPYGGVNIGQAGGYTMPSVWIEDYTTGSGWYYPNIADQPIGTKIYKLKGKNELVYRSYFLPEDNIYIDNLNSVSMTEQNPGWGFIMYNTTVNLGGQGYAYTTDGSTICYTAFPNCNTAFNVNKVGYFIPSTHPYVSSAVKISELISMIPIKAVYDGSGNQSIAVDTGKPVITGYICYGYKDTIPPTGGHTLSPNGWTKNSVTINVTATDNETGVKSIIKPDGEVINAATTSYTVSENGTYTFVLTDNAGNTTNYAVTVSNIDKTAPTATYTLDHDSWTNGSVTVNISAADSGSGVKSITKPDGEIVNAVTASFSVDDNGSFNYSVTDNAGNVANLTATVSNIDKVAPTATYTLDPDSWTNGSVTVNISAADSGSGVKSITKPDGEIVNAVTASFSVDDNGSFNYSVTDNAGNVANLIATVSNIDKVAPVVNHTITPESQTEIVTINVTATDTGSGVKSITKPDGEVVNAATASFVVDDNGTYTFIAEDNLGLITTHIVTISNVVVPEPEPVPPAPTPEPEPEQPAPVDPEPVETEPVFVPMIIAPLDNVIDTPENIPVATNVIITHTVSSKEWTKDDVIITLSAAGADYILTPAGARSNVYVASQNGTYTFTVRYNNQDISYPVVINNIEKTPPTKPIAPVAEEWKSAEQVQKIIIDTIETSAESGIAKIQYQINALEVNQPETTIENGLVKTTNTMTTELTNPLTADNWLDLTDKIDIENEGMYEVKLRSISNAGNISPVAIYKICNDFTAPIISYTFTAADKLLLTVTDNLSGVYGLLMPDGKLVESDTITLCTADLPSDMSNYKVIALDKASNGRVFKQAVISADEARKNTIVKILVVVLIVIAAFALSAILIALYIKYRKDLKRSGYNK